MDGVFVGSFEGLNFHVHENFSSFGLLGYLLILPIVILSLGKITCYKDRTFCLSICGIFLSAFIFIIILTAGFSTAHFRYFLTPMILTAPVLAFSYSKKHSFYKIIISLIVCFNFIVISLFSNQKPFFDVISCIPKFKSFNELRKDLRLRSSYFFNNYQREYILLNTLKQYIPDNSRIGLVFSTHDSIYPLFEENKTWKIYLVRYDELFKRNNFDDYDYLITKGNYQIIYPTTKNVIYEYYPVDKHWINFTGKVKTLYMTRNNKLLFERHKEIPAVMKNIVEDKELLNHYKKFLEIPDGVSESKFYQVYSKS